jgi:hypothetical protein
METKSAAIHRKMPMPARQLPITGFAHKTGIIGDADCPAVVALLDMTAERCYPAGRDGAHDAPLNATEMAGVRVPKSFAVAAEHVRHPGQAAQQLAAASFLVGSAGGTEGEGLLLSRRRRQSAILALRSPFGEETVMTNTMKAVW